MKPLDKVAIVAQHYLICAMWADKEEGTNPRWSKQARAEALKDCKRFIKECGPLFEQAVAIEEYGYACINDGIPASEACYAAFGHDFWLTRCGHGTGFWDRHTLPEGLRDILTTLARAEGDPCFTQYRGWVYLG